MNATQAATKAREQLRSKYENADAIVAEYDRLEAECKSICEALDRAGASYPSIRPLETSFRGALNIGGPVDPLAVTLALKDWVQNLSDIAVHYGLRSPTTPPPSAMAQSGTRATMPPTTGTTIAGGGVSLTAKQTATEIMLAAKGCKSLEELAGTRKTGRNPSLPASHKANQITKH